MEEALRFIRLALIISSSGECRVNRTDARDELRERFSRVNRESTDEVTVSGLFAPRCKALTRRHALLNGFKQIKRGAFRERTASRRFNLTAFGACDHDSEVYVNELEEAI